MSVRVRVAVISAAVVSVAVAGLSMADTAGAMQFLRGEERAKITEAVADQEPFARGGTVRMAVEIELLEGMHANANPPSHDWMIPVEASVAGVDGIGLVEAFYPEPVIRQFPYDTEPYLVYEGKFIVGLVLAIDADIPPGGRELEVIVGYQACNDEACFAPTEAKLEYPVMIAADPADAKAVSSPLLDRAPFSR